MQRMKSFIFDRLASVRRIPLRPPLDAAPALEVWLARLTPAVAPNIPVTTLLDVTELEEIDRLRQPVERERMRCRRELRRLLLARHLHCAPGRLRFARNPGGKPVLCEPAGVLHFSTASAGDWFLLGLSSAQELGVDVESPARLNLSAGLIDLVCSANERAQLALLPEPDRSLAFLRLWTAKEAVLKLRGTGFQESTDVRTLLENLHADECVVDLTPTAEAIVHVATLVQGSVKATRKPKS